MNIGIPTGKQQGRSLGDLLLTVMAACGLLTLLLTVLGALFGVSLLMFRTGSMGPTIPAGAVAIAREIPASAVGVGDVVTVDRGENLLPVTHRVVEISSSDPATGEATFVLRGDANAATDPAPYTVAEVQLVMFTVPGGARAVQLLGHPLVLAGLTAAATALVVWAFWEHDDEDTASAQSVVLQIATDQNSTNPDQYRTEQAV